MPIPNRNPDEKPKDFLQRCMSDKIMNKEYPNIKQRYAICNSQLKHKSKSLLSQFLDYFRSSNDKST